MSWEYFCPHCQAGLDPDRAVVLAATRDDKRVLIGMHPQPGKYTVYLPPQVKTEDGDRWDFSCPVCQTDLATREDRNLCELRLRLEDEHLRILFSCVAGEHATFIVHGDSLKTSLGEHSDRYEPLWNKADTARG